MLPNGASGSESLPSMTYISRSVRISALLSLSRNGSILVLQQESTPATPTFTLWLCHLDVKLPTLRLQIVKSQLEGNQIVRY
jgi:hypothetical protein